MSPRVSVVMSVYNGEDHLPETLRSVLGQDLHDLEFIVVDDGSTDRSGQILLAAAEADPRLRIISQANAGLTKALVRGCAAAIGTYIARQDCGDTSLPGRLSEQSTFLDANPGCSIVASMVEFVAPEGEFLFRSEVPERIEFAPEAGPPTPPPLVAAMFTRAAYLAAGGFRPEFVVAQDVDLWLRLAEQGACLGLRRSHYRARWSSVGISNRHRPEQLRFAAAAATAAVRRRAGADEREVLAQLQGIERNLRPATASERAKLAYFVASCLRKSDPVAARRYYRSAVRDNPFHLKARLRLLMG